jgi:gamma-glutamyltranspeptidase/glutathione hydrolase
MYQLKLTIRLAPLLALLAAPVVPVRASDPDWIARGRHGMVASDSPMASEIGAKVLSQGGHAVDAAIATSFALAVARPYSTGIGGGGFTMVRLSDGRVLVQDARETAPAGSTVDMYAPRDKDAQGEMPRSRHGFLAVAVPQLIHGRAQMHAQFGTVPLDRLIGPAIELAEKGFAVDKHYVKATGEALSKFRKYPQLQQSCQYVYRVHLREGRLREPGEMLKQPELAKLLRAIAEEGPKVVATGAIARSLVDAMRRHGGVITEADLRTSHVRTGRPCGFRFTTTR